MRRYLTLLLPLVAGASAPDPVAWLAGRYSRHFNDKLVDGTSYSADDVAEVVTIDPTHSYLRFQLNFANGHTCSLAGVASADGAALTYRDVRDLAGDGAICTLHVRHSGAKLSWDDDGGSCKSYCGARGSFRDGDLPWASKRSIRYMARLKASSAYREALAEWQTGKPVKL